MAREWYVRVRGHVTGPFSTDDLRTFFRRGQLQPFHEVSRDQVAWQPVGTVIDAPAELPPPPVAEAVAAPARGRGAAGRAVLAVACLVSALAGAAAAWGVSAFLRAGLRQELADVRAGEELLQQQLAAAQQARESADLRLEQALKERAALAEQARARDARVEELGSELATARAAAGKAAGEQKDQATREREALLADRDRLMTERDAARKQVDDAKQENVRLVQLMGGAGLGGEAEVKAELGRLREELDKAAARVGHWKDLMDNLDPAKKRAFFPANPESDEAAAIRKEVRELDAALPGLERRLEVVRRVPAGAAHADEAAGLLGRVRDAQAAWEKARGEIRKYVRGLS